MEKTIDMAQIVSQLLREKTKNGLEPFVSCEEFKKIKVGMFERANRIIDTRFSNTMNYIPDEENFEEICKKIVKSKKLNLWDREVEMKNGGLYATYGLQGKNVLDEWNIPLDIINYIHSYVHQQVLCYMPFIKYDVETFDLSSISEEKLKKSKQIAAYIVKDLIEKYLDKQVEENHWPSQCTDIGEYIFNRDIGSAIDVKGTRKNFLKLYKNAVCVIAGLYKTQENFEISNNKFNCLAYHNFLRVVEYFSFIKNYVYNSCEIRSKEILIKVCGDDVNIKETQCDYFDQYDDDESYKTVNKKLDIKDNIAQVLMKEKTK